MVTPARPVDIGALASMLADRIDSLCAELLPAGIREGAEWRIGSVAGEPGRSMAVHLSGAKAGVWNDWAADVGGDALDLVAQVLFRGDKGQAVRWARAWLGLDSADPNSFEQHRRAVQEKQRAEASREEARRRRQASAIWLAAQPTLAGTVAEAYLRSRAINLAELGHQPRSLRFHAALYNAESQRTWPALVAAVVDPEGHIVATHRTWLATDGSGKAPLRDPKMTLGRYAGGAIRLWRGASGKPLSAAPPGDNVVLTEGIEDALSVALACPEYRVLAGVSLANLRNIELPPQLGAVYIFAQNDPTGSPAERALERAAQHFLSLGRRVKIARPPAGIKDANDLLRAWRGMSAA